MSGALRLLISTPTALLADVPDARSIRAEDKSGGFGVLPGHAKFVTALTDHVLRWRCADGRERYCAIHRGVMAVTNGALVRVACRHGVLGDDLARLEAEVRAATAARLAGESRARVEQTRLHAYAVRQLVRYLRPAGVSESVLMDNGEEEAP